MAFLEVVEHINQNGAKELMKSYFDMLANDLDISSMEFKQLDEGQIEAEMKNQANNSLSIKDLKWKIIPIGYRYHPADTKFYSFQPEPKEIYNEVLDNILAKNRFFDRDEMCIAIRFGVMGGSQDLQLMCQNFGTLFDVGRRDDLAKNEPV